MPRYARLYYPGGLFHVISRCLNREFLINDDEDRRKYLSLLESALSRCDATLLAWCLMSSHVHLVVRAGDDPLDRLMKPLHSGYAGWKNRRAGRAGPVFAARFKSPLVDADTYLLRLVRYVHNNPVRARQAPRAELSPWSSHRAYVGMEPAPPWLNVGEVLGMFSPDPERARQRFAAFVDEGASEPRLPELSGVALEGARRVAASEVGDAWRLSQPVVGPREFAEKVMADLRAREQAEASTVEEERPRRRPELEELLAAACAVLDVEEWQAVWSQFRRLRDSGTLERLYYALHALWRKAAERNEQPTAGIIDSQTVKTTKKGGQRLRRWQEDQRPQAPRARRCDRIANGHRHPARRRAGP